MTSTSRLHGVNNDDYNNPVQNMPVSQMARSLRAAGAVRLLNSATVPASGLNAQRFSAVRTITTTTPLRQQSSSPSPPAASSTSSTPASQSSAAGPANSAAPASSPADRASRIVSPTPNQPTTSNISKTGLSDKPLELETTSEEKIDWTRSFHGLSATPFPKEAADILLAPTDPEEVEIKPDGILYLPEIKYRRILNRAFGPGGWGLVPRSESIVTPKTVTREYALVCNGRYVTTSFTSSLLAWGACA